jgi:hypothetical protein
MPLPQVHPRPDSGSREQPVDWPADVEAVKAANSKLLQAPYQLLDTLDIPDASKEPEPNVLNIPGVTQIRALLEVPQSGTEIFEKLFGGLGTH